MTKTIAFEMITPERVVLRSNADFVVLPAHEGEMGILPGHEPFLVELKAGEVRVSEAENAHSYAIAGGFAEILRDKVSVFAEMAELASEIDAESVRQALERAQSESSRAGLDPLTLAGAEAAIRFAQARLRISELRGHRPRTPQKTG